MTNVKNRRNFDLSKFFQIMKWFEVGIWIFISVIRLFIFAQNDFQFSTRHVEYSKFFKSQNVLAIIFFVFRLSEFHVRCFLCSSDFSVLAQVMSSEVQRKKEENLVIHYSISFKKVCLLTVSCPFLALVICFITAYLFQANDIHETHCRVIENVW